MFFINYIFLFKGVFLGFLSGDTLSFSILLFALLSIFFLLLFAGVFCILLVPFLPKPLAIFLIMISSISAYFMQAYGVIIDKGMLLNVLHTDAKEAFSYFNASLAIWLIFATILPCVYVALVKISYGGFKSALRSRLKIALSTLASAAIIFALMSKIFIPFFREHNVSSVLLPYYPIYYKGHPSKFKKFIPTCDTAELNKCTPDEIANTYDNTILYEDYLQSELINALEARKDKFEVAMFFFSDHGESLGENGIYLHGLPYSIAPDEQKHIPAIIFSSDSELLKKLKARKDESLSHDFVFSSVLGYFGVKTKAYEPEFDIFKE